MGDESDEMPKESVIKDQRLSSNTGFQSPFLSMMVFSCVVVQYSHQSGNSQST